MDRKEDSFEGISSGRYERFVSEYEDISSLNPSVSDSDFRIALKAVLTIRIWLLKYCQLKEKEFPKEVRDPSFIEKMTNKMEKSNFIKMKTTLEYMDLIKKNFLTFDNLIDIKCKAFIKDFDFEKELAEEKEDLDKFCSHLEKKRFPIIWLYTSDWGLRLWFHRRISLSWYSLEENRTFQFLDAMESNKRDVDLIEAIKKSGQQNVQDERSAKDKIIYIYRSIVPYLVQFLQCEYQRVGLLYHSELRFVGDLYRGEVMSPQDFENFRKKILEACENGQTKLFSQDFSSTSTDKDQAIAFISGNYKSGFVKIFHVVHVVWPSEEELEEFNRLFPEAQILSKSIDIKDFSQYKKENEILIWNMKVMNVNMTQNKGIHFIDYVGHGLTLFTDISIPDEKDSVDDYMQAVKLDRVENSTANRSQYLKKYPEQRALYYLQTLNIIASFRWAKNYFSSGQNRNDSKCEIYSTLIKAEYDDLTEFMSIPV